MHLMNFAQHADIPCDFDAFIIFSCTMFLSNSFENIITRHIMLATTWAITAMHVFFKIVIYGLYQDNHKIYLNLLKIYYAHIVCLVNLCSFQRLEFNPYVLLQSGYG